MSSHPIPAERVVLVVDLDGELLAPLRVLEEVLLALNTWAEDDDLDPPDRRDPLHLPAPLADGEALAAVQRLQAALGPTQSLGPDRGRLLSPDGSYEHAPFSVVTLPAVDIEILSAAARALGHPALSADVADLVEDYARSFAVDPYARSRTDRAEFVSKVARVAGLLDLAPTEDTQLLTARLAANPPGLDLALTTAEEAAYQRTADRMNRLWSLGSGVDRYLY
jgi:hypothetical protein